MRLRIILSSILLYPLEHWVLQMIGLFKKAVELSTELRKNADLNCGMQITGNNIQLNYNLEDLSSQGYPYLIQDNLIKVGFVAASAFALYYYFKSRRTSSLLAQVLHNEAQRPAPVAAAEENEVIPHLHFSRDEEENEEENEVSEIDGLEHEESESEASSDNDHETSDDEEQNVEQEEDCGSLHNSPSF